ncbi:hypothetical protein HPK19_06030 [Arthrobacter citreus]|nr:hypothetical protein HPK19_06030 [Arthrobacter citreus]
MKKILMILCFTFVLFGCSLNTNTESKDPKTVAIVAVSNVNTIIYSSDKNRDQIQEIVKGFASKKAQKEQNETPKTDLNLWFINESGKKEEFAINYNQNLVLRQGGKVYKINSKTTELLQELFMN